MFCCSRVCPKRFHGIFDDDLSTVLNVDPSGTVTYSFFNLDSIYDFLLSIGMKPYVELRRVVPDLGSQALGFVC